MKSKLLGRACALVALAALSGSSGAAFGSAVTYVGSGLNHEDPTGSQATVSAEADFYIINTGIVGGKQTWDIHLVLKNTTAAQSGGLALHQADILTGVVFTMSPTSVKLNYNSSTNPTLHKGSKMYLSQSAYNSNTPLSTATANSDLANTWSSTLTSSSLGNTGVGTSGWGNEFSMSGISGGAPGSTNYGLANSNYPLGTGSDFTNHFPYILNALNFDFTVTGPATLSPSQISGVEFLFGTSQTCPITGSIQNPEPGTMTLSAIGVLGLACWRRRSRKKLASAA